MLKDALLLHTTFEICSSFQSTSLMCTQWQNKGKCTKRASKRLETTTLMDKDVPLAHISPLFMENYFHPLSDTDGEEEARRIVAIVLLPIIRLALPPARRPPVLCFHTVLKRISRETGQLEAIVLHDLRVNVPRRLRTHVNKDRAVERKSTSLMYSMGRRTIVHTRLIDELVIQGHPLVLA